MLTFLKKRGWLLAIVGLWILEESGAFQLTIKGGFSTQLTCKVNCESIAASQLSRRIRIIREYLGEEEPFAVFNSSRQDLKNEFLKLSISPMPGASYSPDTDSKPVDLDYLARVTKFDIGGAWWTPFYKNAICDLEIELSSNLSCGEVNASPNNSAELSVGGTLQGRYRLKNFGLFSHKKCKQRFLEQIIADLQSWPATQ